MDTGDVYDNGNTAYNSLLQVTKLKLRDFREILKRTLYEYISIMHMHNDNIRIRYRPHTMVLPVAKGNISYIINIYSNTFITYIYYLKKRYINMYHY